MAGLPHRPRCAVSAIACIVVNSAAIAGHCVLEDDVIVGGLSGTHQFVRIGKGAIIGAVTMVTNDVIPYGLVQSAQRGVAGRVEPCGAQATRCSACRYHRFAGCVSNAGAR